MTAIPRSPRRLDLRGLLCPLVVRRVRRAIAALSVGEELRFTGDDPAMRIDIRAWCEEDGHELVAMEEADGEIHCRVRRRGTGSS